MSWLNQLAIYFRISINVRVTGSEDGYSSVANSLRHIDKQCLLYGVLNEKSAENISKKVKNYDF